MKKTTAGFLALTAVTLAGCEDVLTIPEAQEQLDAAFVEIGAMPKFTSDRFQEFSDPEGDCAVAYRDRERGVDYTEVGVNYTPDHYMIAAPQMVRVDCDDLQSAFHKAEATFAVRDVQSLSGEDSMTEHYEKAMNEYKASVTNELQRSRGVLSIGTIGLK